VNALPSVFFMTWLAAVPTAASAQVPSLSHTAPQLGNPLSIELAGAAPGASVRLFFSSTEASTVTPYGTLELERSGLTLIASGPADPQGHFVHQQNVPPDPALAETWGHYQALVQDASAANGWVLSQAAHLRYLGTRLYETSLGTQFEGQVHPAELRVVSLPQAQTLGGIPLADRPLPWFLPGLKGDDGEPVFSADLALGAVVPFGDRLIVFDNFSLSTRAVIPLRGASLTAVEGLDGRSAVVLEAGAARIVWVDLATATVTESLNLPWPVSELWTVLPGAREAWISEEAPGQSRPALRRVDLEQRVVLESVAVGWPPGCDLKRIDSGPNVVLAASLFSEVYSTKKDPFQLWTGTSLSAVDRSSTSPSVTFAWLGDVSPPAMQVIGDFVALATHWWWGPGSEALQISPLDDPLALRALPPPPSYYTGSDIEYRAFEWDGDGFWALHPCCDWDGGWGAILRFSFQTQQWAEFGTFNQGTYALALARDEFTHQVAVAVDGIPCSGCPTPSIELLEVSSSSFVSIAGGWRPIALRALTVP
jgi:hypothetical protein